MYTKTAKAVASLHIAANHLDETWKMYDQTDSGMQWWQSVAITGGIAAFVTGHFVTGCFCHAAWMTTGMTGDVFLSIYGCFLSRKWSPELEEAEQHFTAAEKAVTEIKDTIHFWKEIPILAKKLRKIHEDILQKAENVPISPIQSGTIPVIRQATATKRNPNEHFSIRDIVKNWGRGAAKILRQKAEELNELTQLQ